MGDRKILFPPPWPLPLLIRARLYWHASASSHLLCICDQTAYVTQSHLLHRPRTMWLFLTSFCRLFLYHSQRRWQAEKEWLRSLSNLHRERGLNQILPCWLAAHLIAPGAGLQISAASLLKTGLLPLHGSHNKQGCLSLCLSSRRLTMRGSLSWPCPARFIHQPPKKVKTPVPRMIPPLNESTPPSYVCFSSGQKRSAQICFAQYLSTNLSRSV